MPPRKTLVLSKRHSRTPPTPGVRDHHPLPDGQEDAPPLPGVPGSDPAGSKGSPGHRGQRNSPVQPDQSAAELGVVELVADFEEQADEWLAAGDDTERVFAEWALKRSMVHAQLLDTIATGAGGNAKINAVIRAQRSFSDDLVKILRAMQRKGQPSDEANSKPNKRGSR